MTAVFLAILVTTNPFYGAHRKVKIVEEALDVLFINSGRKVNTGALTIKLETASLICAVGD